MRVVVLPAKSTDFNGFNRAWFSIYFLFMMFPGCANMILDPLGQNIFVNIGIGIFVTTTMYILMARARARFRREYLNPELPKNLAPMKSKWIIPFVVGAIIFSYLDVVYLKAAHDRFARVTQMTSLWSLTVFAVIDSYFAFESVSKG